MSQEHTGKCLCGAVRFRVDGRLRDVVACHCVECRRQSGHYVAATNVDDANLHIGGADRLTWYRASDFAKRGFCGTCGSVLFWKHDGETKTSIMAGAFDMPTGLRMTQHIFCEEKGDYYEIEDGPRKFPRSNQELRVSEN